MSAAVSVCRARAANHAPKCFVSLSRLGPRDPFLRAWQGDTDEAGVRRLTEVVPGRYRAFARPVGHTLDTAQREIIVDPGRETRVELTVHARGKGGG